MLLWLVFNRLSRFNCLDSSHCSISLSNLLLSLVSLPSPTACHLHVDSSSLQLATVKLYSILHLFAVVELGKSAAFGLATPSVGEQSQVHDGYALP